MSDRVIIERSGAVAHVQLNRPDKHNGLDLPLIEALLEAGKALRDERGVRAIVLSGRGKSFCAGLDFASVMTAPGTAQRLLERGDDSPANGAQRVAWIWQEVPVPVIAAIRGVAFGGGLQIALGADLRIVHPEAELSVMEIRWGLIPDMALSQTLPRLVGLDVAKELTFTGRKVSGTEAVRLGLATRLADNPVATALEMATAIAARNPHAIRAAKRLLNEAPRLPVRQAFELETELQLGLLGSRNALEAMSANFAKRSPEFEDPT